MFLRSQPGSRDMAAALKLGQVAADSADSVNGRGMGVSPLPMLTAKRLPARPARER